MRTRQEQISIVIPTLNAAATLPLALASVASAPLVGEIIIVDGGSSDDTVKIARAAGARSMAAPRGRGSQLAAGAAAARCGSLLFLHADCRLAPGWAAAVGAFLETEQAATRAGYFDLVLDDAAAPARRVERLVGWRCRWLALPYGDQGLLISRRLYDVVGGFRPLPLMEDVDLVSRLGRARLAPIGGACIASARRYRDSGYWRRPLRNLFCLTLYYGGASTERIARIYG